MEIKINETDDTVIINIEGSVDLLDSNFDELQDILFDIGKKNDKNIEVDLSEAVYLDSSGIGLFLSAAKLQNKKGKTFKIKKSSLQILNTLQMSSVYKILCE